MCVLTLVVWTQRPRPIARRALTHAVVVYGEVAQMSMDDEPVSNKEIMMQGRDATGVEELGCNFEGAHPFVRQRIHHDRPAVPGCGMSLDSVIRQP